MATNTTNLGLIKPAGTDKVRIAQINQNMDILDEKIGPVGNTSVQNQIIANDSGMAIVSTGNTHSAIASGQYVYIRSHGTLAEGLYKANSAISANATLSTSNVTHISSGGMNDLKDRIDSLNSQLASDWGTKTTDWLASAEQDGSGAAAVFSKSGKMVTIAIVTASHAHAENDQIATIETGYRPNVLINTIGSIGTTPCIVRFGTDGRVLIWLLSGSVTGRLYVTVTFATP